MMKHEVATREEWLAARNQLLAKEKELSTYPPAAAAPCVTAAMRLDGNQRADPRWHHSLPEPLTGRNEEAG
jgi:Bacterial protein of unknown function (DUF899)